MDPLLYYIFGLSFLALLFADATAEWLKAIQDSLGKRQRALLLSLSSPDRTFTPSAWRVFC